MLALHVRVLIPHPSLLGSQLTLQCLLPIVHGLLPIVSFKSILLYSRRCPYIRPVCVEKFCARPAATAPALVPRARLHSEVRADVQVSC